MMYEDSYLVKSCIIAENRRDKPYIDEVADACPFCPGHESDIDEIRLQVKEHAKPFQVKIVNNKYPVCDTQKGLYGVHDVVIDTPDHLAHPKDFTEMHWEVVLISMQKRWHQIAKDPKISFIQIFKNYGKNAGASIKHSHWQIIALAQTPYSIRSQHLQYHAFKDKEGDCYFCTKLKTIEKEYIIFETKNWLAIAPEVSQFAHETWLISKSHKKHYGELGEEALKECGGLLKRVLMGYDKVRPSGSFNICFIGGGIRDSLEHHFYIKIIPRLGEWAGFELATNCYINTVHPKTHAQVMKNILRQ